MHTTILKYFEGTLSTEERTELFKQIDNDASLRQKFIEAQSLYALTTWLPSDRDEIEGIDSLFDFKQKQKKAKITIFHKHLFGYTAAVILSMVASWGVLQFRTIREKALEERMAFMEESQITYEEFTAPAGQRALLKLQDGTTVWLNARTTLRYPNKFSRKERRVELEGEAFFDVKKNEEIPFVVTTDRLDIKVTGTSFNVFAYRGQEEFNTSLTEGSVWVYDKKDDSRGLKLLPNERAVMIKNQLYKQPFIQMDFLLWKEGIYAFDNLPFTEIVTKLELYYDIKIVVENEEIRKYKFSGKFRQRDGIEYVFRTLKKIRDFKYLKDDDLNAITII